MAGCFLIVGGEKRILRRVLREAGVVLTPEAQVRLDALLVDKTEEVTRPVAGLSPAELEAELERLQDELDALDAGLKVVALPAPTRPH